MSEYIVCPHCHNPLGQSEYVKVVRCRDCAYFIDGKYCDNSYLLAVDPDGYCAWGERRED